MIAPPIATGGRRINPAVAELADINRWVCWKLERRKGKLAKVPYIAGSRQRASSTDPRTWNDFDTCWRSAFVNGAASGIGFVVDGSDDLMGADLDDCIHDSGVIMPWARIVVRKLDSYTERSPSGGGLRVLFKSWRDACDWGLDEKGEPKGGRAVMFQGGKVELYRFKRFLTVTGNHLEETPETINSVAPEIIAELIGPLSNGPVHEPAVAPAREISDELRDRLEQAMADDSALWAAYNGEAPDEGKDQTRSGYEMKLAGALRRHGDFSFGDFATLAHWWPYGKGADGNHRERRRTWEKAAPDQPRPAPIFANGPDIGAQTVTWLWYPRLPANQIALLGAPGGGGKGLNAVEYVACITRGRCWPCRTSQAPLGNVLWCEAEDPLPEVVVPRLMAADADRARIQFATREAFAAAQDGLRGYITERGVRLIVLSPLVSFLTGLSDINGELGVRDVLERLQGCITGTGCGIIGLAHTNKKADLRAIERVLGTVAFTNFVRSVLLVGRDREEPNWFRLTHAKHNLSTKADDLLYRPVHVGEDPRDQFVKLEWRHPADNIDVDAIFDRPKGDNSGKPSAGQWLISYLEEHGMSLRADIIMAGGRQGFKEETLKKAMCRSPRIKSEQEGFQGPVYWSLNW